VDVYRLCSDESMTLKHGWPRMLGGVMGLLIAGVIGAPIETRGAPSAEQFQRWAVIIGVGGYQPPVPPLGKVPLNDAQSFYDFLTSPSGGQFDKHHIKAIIGDQITVADIRDALGTFLAQANDEDYVVVYLSGHGLPDPRNPETYYFLPSHGRLDRLAGSAIEMADILKYVARVRAKRKLMIMDACHSGAVGTAGALKGINLVNSYLRELHRSYTGFAMLTSSQDTQFSQVLKEKEQSVFTHFLLRALQDDANMVDGSLGSQPDGVIDPQEAFEYVRKKVTEYTSHQQTPDSSGLDTRFPLAIVPKAPSVGGFDIVSPPSLSPAAAPLTPSQSPVPPIEEARAPQYGLPAPPPSEFVGRDGAPMVLIPAGDFEMGRIGYKENPPRRRSLPPYYIDKYEVTVERYSKYLADTGAPDGLPVDWGGVKPAVHGNHPVAGVNYFDAFAYCDWAGKRLPTDEEWEKAARGTDGRIYPWGNEQPQIGMTNFNQNYCFFCNIYDERLAPVGHYQRDRSPYGVFDMAGNVMEWVSLSGMGLAHLRGGDWRTEGRFLELSRIGSMAPHSRAPGGNPDQGFRCAMNVPLR
jgi:formylglycine-generating enzyme required for sulfatase activity